MEGMKDSLPNNFNEAIDRAKPFGGGEDRAELETESGGCVREICGRSIQLAGLQMGIRRGDRHYCGVGGDRPRVETHTRTISSSRYGTKSRSTAFGAANLKKFLVVSDEVTTAEEIRA